MSEGFIDIQGVAGVWPASRVTQMPGYRSVLQLQGIWIGGDTSGPPDPGGEAQGNRYFMVNVGGMMGLR